MREAKHGNESLAYVEGINVMPTLMNVDERKRDSYTDEEIRAFVIEMLDGLCREKRLKLGK